MKKIECYLRPEQAADIVEALKLAGATGVTVIPAQGFGVERVPDATLRPKTKLEILTDEAALPGLLDAVTGEARSGRIGDGKIVVSSVEEVIRVRTGATGVGALY
jgi:nitrogen regulatory protein PII